MTDFRASMNSKRNKLGRRGRGNASVGSDQGRGRVQVAGNWKQTRDRYLALAVAAASSGDAIEAENYYQHAEHYLRLMQENVA